MAQAYGHKRSRWFNTQFMTSCISTTLVLILLGTIVFFMLSAKNLSAFIKENLNVSVLVNDELKQADIDSLQAELTNSPYVKRLTFISKEQALLRIRAQKPESYFREKCDHVLENTGTQEEFQEKCLAFFREFIIMK